MRIWEEVTGNSWEAGDTRGQASQGRGLRVGAGTPNATSRTSLPELDSWVQVLVPRPLRLQGTSQQGTGGDVSCHLQSSGQLLGGRGHALGGPRKGPLCWPLTWLPWRQSGYSLGATSRDGLPGAATSAGQQLRGDASPSRQGELCPFSGWWGL